MTIPSGKTGNSVARGRHRTDSQGSDDGSSSEGELVPNSDDAASETFRISTVTDSTAAPQTSRQTEVENKVKYKN